MPKAVSLCLMIGFLAGLPQSRADSIYINTWLIAGTFDNDKANGGYEKDWIGEAGVQPREGVTTAGKTWRYFDDRLFSRNYDDYQDLYSYFKVKLGKPIGSKVAYAHVYVYSETSQPGRLRMGADNEFKAWVNGRPVGSSVKGTPARDAVAMDIMLAQGWNRLLVKVANQEEGRFGFYARLSDKAGQPLPGITYSVNGPEGKLAITTQAMTDARTGNLPVGWREWSYVGAHPDPDKIYDPADQTSNLDQFILNPGLMMQASDFRLQAQGGVPPYRWVLREGDLPPGLELHSDGRIVGTIAAGTRLGEYKFKVRVRDSQGTISRKDLTITVRERPNKWVEQARLIALLHNPEGTPGGDVEGLVRLMKAQGYQLGMPISYNNGDKKFRWPSRFAQNKTDQDWDAKYKAALEGQGLKFGMYMGNVTNTGETQFSDNQAVVMVEEAIQLYHPKALWFDWSGLDGISLDSLYSMIRSCDPELIIILNGYIRGSNGDWDIICFEGWNAWADKMWDIWPMQIPWPKKHTPESWRLLVQPEWTAFGSNTSDWQEYLRVQISLIAEGFIADIDHTGSLVQTPKYKKLLDAPLMQFHRKMADWANPSGLEPLHHSYILTDPGPLTNDFWGYNTINLNRDTIYLHLLKNQRGKTGMPPESTMTVQPLIAKVKRIVCMNTGKPVSFVQRKTSTDKTITLDLAGITPDPVDTIFKIELESPLPDLQTPKPRPQIPAGNLATFKPARLLSLDAGHALVPSAGQYAYKGVDGKENTTAAGAWEYPWTYEVNLERTYLISRIVIIFNKTGFATEYKVLVSDDGKTWNQIAHKTNDRGGRHEIAITPTDAQYIQIQGLKPDGPNQPGGQMSIAELQVFQEK